MLDPADGLDLRGLAVGAPIFPVLVVSAVLVTLHNVLLSSIAGVLITHKGAALHMHGAHLLVAPAHGLQRWVVITQLYTAAHEVLLLKDGHTTVLVDSAADGAQGHHPLHMVAQIAAVGIPLGVFSFLQDKLLPLEVMVLISHPGAALHTDRADVVKPTLLDVAALRGELLTLALEMLLLEHGHLKARSHVNAGC